MDTRFDYQVLLAEPIGQLLAEPIMQLLVLLFVLLLGVGVYRLSGLRRRRLRRRRASLRKQAARAETPRERRTLMLQWSELGGLDDYQRAARRDSAREDGRKARTAGQPLSANPFGHGLWGAGRQWKQGWRMVDQNIRWLESQRGPE